MPVCGGLESKSSEGLQYHVVSSFRSDSTGDMSRQSFDASIKVINQAINAGWVRGRYGTREISDHGVDYWDPTYHNPTSGMSYELSLQGQPDQVLKAAREISKRRRVSDLYLDFNSGARMESIHLSGESKEIYLETGQFHQV